MSHQDNETNKNKGIYLLPNLFTSAALFSGFYAIVAASQHHFRIAAIAIFVAMIMDALDGRVARMTGTQSAFGAEYDSLSDMVSFGVSPALVVYFWALEPLKQVGWLISFLFVACVALRLARFNTSTSSSDKRYFYGLPCPAAAAAIAGYVWLGQLYGFQGVANSIIVAIMTVYLSLMMVSSIKYRSFKDYDFKSSVPFATVVAIVLIYILFVALDPEHVLFTAFSIYALSGPLGGITIKLFEHIKQRRFLRRNKDK
ncbi:CDP-diacylglycerol--serine O-phosphatidyltransferase [Thiotrichales bacterium 19S11-10]|nr:CDP-diacylglycerol--serine O-phosphatidyltransferase [Thiotrichales bacterium 19S11-10]MCF6807932.1 CDP-diacylglycerol--serine O-phosphatidyltransferase [Thiotrichales bacterium 19S9-11]MCF6811947.1 CDP-diacylglycerol--serine O-phosphatidyltransferase [Thiotrichales bacterium 19S9-12]